MSAQYLTEYFLEQRYQKICKGELKKFSNNNLNESIEKALEPAIEIIAEPVVKAVAEPAFNFTKAALERLFGAGTEGAVKAVVDPHVMSPPAEAPVVRVTPKEIVKPETTLNTKPFATYKQFKFDIPTNYPMVKVEPEMAHPTNNQIVKVEPREVHIPEEEPRIIGDEEPKRIGETDTETETKTEPKRIGETDTETETKTEPKRIGETDTETETKTELKRIGKTKTDTETEPKTETKTEPKTDTETEPNTDRETEPETKKPGKTKTKFKLPPIFPNLGGGQGSSTSLYSINPTGSATDIGLNLGVESIGTFARRQVMR